VIKIAGVSYLNRPQDSINAYFYRMIDLILGKIRESAELKGSLPGDHLLIESLNQVANAAISCYREHRKILWCGNGGSAADAQHLSAELSGRYYYDRPPLFSEALHVNSSYLTAVANDYSYEEVFSRLVEAMGNEGDMLIGLSTSGNSGNVVRAMKKAREKKMITVAFTGRDGGKLKEHCDHLVAIPSTDTPRVQECHMLLGHILCELVEMNLFPMM
jgi:D-sedoheptulose 7-phosphate isomerase